MILIMVYDVKKLKGQELKLCTFCCLLARILTWSMMMKYLLESHCEFMKYELIWSRSRFSNASITVS